MYLCMYSMYVYVCVCMFVYTKVSSTIISIQLIHLDIT